MLLKNSKPTIIQPKLLRNIQNDIKNSSIIEFLNISTISLKRIQSKYIISSEFAALYDYAIHAGELTRASILNS